MSRSSRFVSVAAGGVALALAASLAGCGGDQGAAQSAAAVGSPQTCYRLPTGDAAHARVLSGGDGDLMTCAMHVEAWRLMNGQRAAMGLYQGHYVWASADGGITSAETLQAPRFHVYTPGQQADMDGKIRILIQRRKTAGGDTAGGTWRRMAMLKLHHSPQSRSSRMVWLLEEIGEPYEIAYLDIRAEGGLPESYRAVHPLKKAPALQHDGETVTESAAI